MDLIASSVPGRLRVRHRALCGDPRLDALRAAVARWRGVVGAETNPRAGSLLIRYHTTQLTLTACERRVVAAVEKLLVTHVRANVRENLKKHTKVGAGETAAQRHHHGGTLRVRVNRWAKRSMLASLGGSLALAVAGSKRWHALSGGLFLTALALHLWVHRRHILR